MDFMNVINEAESYSRTVLKSSSGKRIFNNEIIKNITSIAMEKYLVGFLMSKGKLPEGHTLEKLYMEASAFLPRDNDLLSRLVEIDLTMNLCSLEIKENTGTSDDEILFLLEVLNEIRIMIKENTEPVEALR